VLYFDSNTANNKKKQSQSNDSAFVFLELGNLLPSSVSLEFTI